MSILGIGVDVVHLPRIASLISRRGPERFAHRILSHTELDAWKSRSSDSVRFLAVRFSVKEAAYKALYPEVRPTWKELSYYSFGDNSPGSKPFLIYEPTISGVSNPVGNILVSVSHDGEYVFSTVVVQCPK